jgi:hypothetical protein
MREGAWVYRLLTRSRSLPPAVPQRPSAEPAPAVGCDVLAAARPVGQAGLR